MAVEVLTPSTLVGSGLFSALKRVFKCLGVIEADPNALDVAVRELLDTIKKISNRIFDHSSVFKHTAKYAW